MKNHVKNFSQFAQVNENRFYPSLKKRGFAKASLGHPHGSHGNAMYNTVEAIMKADSVEAGVEILEDALTVLIDDRLFMDSWKDYSNDGNSFNESKESDEFGMDEMSLDGGIANVYLSTSMSGEFATVNFNGQEASIDEEESLRKTWQKILRTAMKMGASGIYSVEDGMMLTQSDINKLDDSPSGWE